MERSLIKQILLLLVLFFSLNFIWEVTHSLLYYWDQYPLQNNIQFFVPRILAATLGDLLVLALLFLGISSLHKDFKWINKPSKLDNTIVVTYCLIVSVLIEIRGVYLLKRWTYDEMMPLIFGIGLSPLVQLVITCLIALWLVRK